jgi:hypothetical protein
LAAIPNIRVAGTAVRFLGMPAAWKKFFGFEGHLKAWQSKGFSSYTMIYPLMQRRNTINQPDKEWQDRVRGMLRAELARRNLSYADLADRLRMIGVEDTPKNLSNKIARGRFTAAFFMQCMRAIGCRTIHLDR